MKLSHSTEVEKVFFNENFPDTDAIRDSSFLSPYMCLFVLSNNWEVSPVFSDLLSNMHPLKTHIARGTEYKATNYK